MKRAGGIAFATVVGVALFVFSPIVLRQIDFFRVRQIEIVGLEYLRADTVLDSLGLDSMRTVFHPESDIVDRALTIPGIVSVTVERRLPGTLRITFEERVPIAFVGGEDRFVPLDASGNLLPYDPLDSQLDLPVIARLDSQLVSALAVVRATDPRLFEETKSATIRPDSTVVLELADQVLLLRGVPTTEELAAIADVRRYLADQAQTAGEIDARFLGSAPHRRVIVRRETS